MNTLEINYYASTSPVTRDFYAGCFPANLLPMRRLSRKILPIGFVVNLCNSDRSDDFCHWVLIFVKKGGIGKRNQIIFYDSGAGSSYKENVFIKKFLNLQQIDNIQFLKYPHQGIFSNKCGLFVLCCFYALCLKISLSKFSNLFKKRPLAMNDKIINKLFKFAYLKKCKSA